MLVFEFATFENKKYAAMSLFHGNGPFGEIPSKKEPIRTFKCTSRIPCHIIGVKICFVVTLSPRSHAPLNNGIFHRRLNCNNSCSPVRDVH